MLPDPIPYSESESLSLQRRFRFLVSFFSITFSSLFDLSLNCAKDCSTGLGFFPLFLAARKSDFSVPSFSKRWQSQVLCVVYAPPCFLQRSRCFSVRPFLGTLGLFQYPVATYSFYRCAKVSRRKMRRTCWIFPGHTSCCAKLSRREKRWTYRIFPGHIRARLPRETEGANACPQEFHLSCEGWTDPATCTGTFVGLASLRLVGFWLSV
jgi:hypothetical protein